TPPTVMMLAAKTVARNRFPSISNNSLLARSRIYCPARIGQVQYEPQFHWPAVPCRPTCRESSSWRSIFNIHPGKDVAKQMLYEHESACRWGRCARPMKRGREAEIDQRGVAAPRRWLAGGDGKRRQR